MDTQGAPQTAGELRISLPRLHRIVRGHPGVSYNTRGHLRLDASAVEYLRSRVGVIPEVSGLTRTETQVLIAISRHSRGLVSIRQVARAAGVSPTSAARAITTLKSRDLVRQDPVLLFDGKVVEREVFTIKWDSQTWLTVAPLIARAVLPKQRLLATSRHLPPRLASTFWTGDWRNINVTTDALAVAERILNEGHFDPEATAYLGTLPIEVLESAIEHRRHTQSLASSTIAVEKRD
ncbi:MarR family transcriptional regulator [Ferrimicrobium sp.]|uniref:MarR family transcriptional regulator n=1 Tax=Ferrimicrobium sp. TaxID=2926050 RepID=UPI00260C9F89|nr:MarR family transcriptional regulator [Ferrimicrobium sp.]